MPSGAAHLIGRGESVGWLQSLFGTRPKMTIDEVFRFYRGLGFFRQGDLGSTPRELLARYESDWRRPPDPDKAWDDVFLLAYDEERVWQGDPECDVCDENLVYTDVLKEWAAISGGAFDPKDIEEIWASEEGPIELSFTFVGQRHVIRPEWSNDWFDLNILTRINALLEPTGRHFACASDVNYAIVFLIDQETRQRMTAVRGFPFIL